jgi:WD40 repeat protein
MTDLSTLDDLLTRVEHGDPLAPTPDQLRSRLSTGLLWWQAVSNAVTEAPDRLTSWERGTDRLLAAAVGDRELRAATRIIAAVGVVLAAARGDLPRSAGVEAITAAARRWEERGLLAEESGGPHRWQDATGALALVDALPEGSARSLAHIAVGLMSGATQAPAYQHEVRILFDTGERKGATGSLKVAVLPGGPPGLFPDPRSMTFLQVDEDFTSSLNAAWTYATRHRQRPPCVLWSIDAGSRPLVPITGPSLGTAFAVALVTALRRVTVFDPVWRWREKCAVTGAVSPSGAVGSVHGLEGKFEAARAAGWNVVAPRSNRDISGTPLVAGVDVQWVSNVRQARRGTRRWRPNRLITVVAVVALAAAVVFGISQVVGREEDRGIAQRQEAVSQLLKETSTRRNAQQVQALRYALAALALESSDRVKGATVAALTARRDPVTLFTGRGEVTATAFTRGGHALIAGAMGATTWDVRSLSSVQEVGDLKTGPQPSAATVAAVSADGRVAVVERSEERAELWDLGDKTNPRRIAELPSCELVSAAIDANGQRMLTGCADGTVTLWDLTSREAPASLGELQPRPRDVRAVALTRDGAAVATSQGVLFWTASKPGDPLRPAGQGVKDGDEGDARALAVGEPGVVAGYIDGTRLLSVTPRPANLTFEAESAITAVAVGAYTRLILTGDERGQAVLWAPGRGGYRPTMLLNGHTDSITSVGLSEDGSMALTGSRDGSVRLWDVHSGGPYDLSGSAPLGSAVDQVVVSPKNSVSVVINDAGEASLWDLADPSRPNRLTGIKSHRGPVHSAAFDPEHSTRLATGSDDGEVVLTDITAPENPRELVSMTTSGPVKALAFNASGTKIAAGTDDGGVVVADVDARKLAPVKVPRGDKHPVRAVVYGRDPDVLAVGDASGQVELWQGATRVGRIALDGYGGVRALAFDPRGKTLLVASELSNAVRQWDISSPGTPKELPVLPAGAGKVRAIAYSRDGRLVVGADTEGAAVVWSVMDPGTPHRLVELTGHTGAVLAVGIAAGGTTVVSGSLDKTIITWDVSELVTIIDNLRDRACREAQRPMTDEEWRSHDYLRQLPYSDNCAGR